MKGVIMQIEGKKAVVLYNNGRFGVIRAPAGCEAGMSISVTSNKKMMLALSLCALCALVFLVALYLTPAGYMHIAAANAELEVAYNRLRRIRALRPLNAQSVPIAAELAVLHKPIPRGWRDIIDALARAGYLSGSVEVIIAQDPLADANVLQDDLVSLSESMRKTLYPALRVEVSLYTIELYQKAMTGPAETPDPSEPHHGGEWMEPRDMMNRRQGGNCRW